MSEVQSILLSGLLAEYEQLTEHMQIALGHLQSVLEPWQQQMDLLQTIPGINEQSAADILAEIGPDLDAFPSRDKFTAWAGVCPGNNESAGKRRPGGARRGSVHLRTILTLCAHAASRTKDCQFKGKHRLLASRRGYKRAIVATAHKLAKVIWAVLRDQKAYWDPDIDYDEIMVRRNAPRWIQQLKKYKLLYDNDESSTDAMD